MKPHSFAWKEKFLNEARGIEMALGPVITAIHHIGSTSIPRIHAKPVIDILLEVSDLAQLDARSSGMVALGYGAMGEFGIPGRRFFRKSDEEGFRTHHVHAFLFGTPDVMRHLAFRDYLIAHPAVATEYEALKLRLVATCEGNMEVYMDGKDSFIKETECKALEWWSGCL